MPLSCYLSWMARVGYYCTCSYGLIETLLTKTLSVDGVSLCNQVYEVIWKPANKGNKGRRHRHCDSIQARLAHVTV